MNFLKLSVLFFIFLILSACEDLPFTDEDTLLTEVDKGIATTEIQPIEEEETLEEIFIIPKDLTLSRNRLIQSKTVILDMVTIQTLQYDLTIIADEFISHHSVVRNFPDGETALEKEIGRSGGHILIKAKKAKGSLQLIFNGENAGFVPKKSISRRERGKISGRNGGNGYDAIYDTWCRDIYIPLGLGLLPGKIVIDKDCWQECRVNPTRGGNGEDGRQGYPGYDGKRGGDSGSFYLQAFNLSDFHLTDVKKTIGLGSRGGKGSAGGYGGERGKNGRDREGLCSSNLPRPKRGSKGNRGRRGKDGTNGKIRKVCLENLKNENQQAQENIQTASLETNNNQAKTEKIEIKCDESGSGVMCREVLVENNSDETLKKEGVVCY